MATTTTETTKAVSSDRGKTETENEVKIKLPLKPFILTTPEGDISETGQQEIEWYLAQTLNMGLNREYHELPDEFEWKWTTNRGTLPKRIQSHYYKQHGVKLSAEIIQQIGNLGKTHTSKAQTVVIDFTDSIDWSDGDFGDGGSCFWGEKCGAKRMIENNGWAVRAYRARTGYTITEGEAINFSHLRGYARAWVADIGERLIVFNGYGEGTIVFARMLAHKFNCSYRRISLLNNGYDDGTLWINGAVGYVVGRHSEIEGMVKHDLGWPDETDDRYYCEICENRMTADDSFQAYDENGGQLTVCEYCRSECDRCCEQFVYKLKSFEGARYCNECREKQVDEAIDVAKGEVSEAESEVEEAEAELEKAREKLEAAEAKLEELEAEVNS